MGKLVKANEIKSMIIELRGQKIMIDRDLAQIYGVKSRRLREQVKRNKKRFPIDFMFQLNDKEIDFMVSQSATPFRQSLGGYRPYAFTRNGANMLSTVLHTKTAIMRSIQIMRAFSAFEEAMSEGKKALTQSPDIVKELSIHSRAIMHLFQELTRRDKKIGKLGDVQKDMVDLLQQVILASINSK